MSTAAPTEHPPSLAELPAPTLSEHDGVRYLHLDSIWVQGAMRIARPAQIELEYVQRMMAWLLAFEPGPLQARHAVQFGLGAGALTRFCLNKLRMRCTVVELNPGVIEANRIWFRLPAPGERLQVVCADALHWAADPENAGTVDALCIDLYDQEAAGPVHDSLAFYRLAHRLLAPGGVVSINLFGRHASYERSAARLARVFGAGRLRSLQPTREGNTVVLGLRDAEWPDRETLARRAAGWQARSGLPCTQWMRLWRQVTPSEGVEAGDPGEGA